MSNEQENTEAMKYIRSLKNAVKRRYAVTYNDWILAGRIGGIPSRGTLSPTIAKSVCTNLDSLS